MFVDDGSTDGTLDLLNELAEIDERLKIYSFSRNFGHQAALYAGLNEARGDAVIFMDSDLQHPPELIPQLITHWNSGYDIVSTIRVDTEDASFLKKVSSHLFYKFFNALSPVNIPEGAADFGLFSCRVCASLRQMPETHRFLRGMTSWLGYKRVFIRYNAPARYAGVSKFSARKMIGMAGDAVFSFSSMPLRIATRLGFLCLAVSVLYLTYSLLVYLLGSPVPGWTSLLAVGLLMGGSNMFFLGLLGEYVSRIYEETKRRPLYLFKQNPAS